MSHFIGLVFVDPNGQDVDELLAPYNEQDETYMEFQDKTDEVKELYDKMPDSVPSEGKFIEEIDRTDLINQIWDEAPDEPEHEDEFWKPYNKKDYPTPTSIAEQKRLDIIPDETKRNGVRFVQQVENEWSYQPSKEKFPTLDDLADRYFGYSKIRGRYGYMKNPQAKYDYYVDGGRWGGYLINKEGKNTDHDLATEIDWEKQEVPFCFVDTNGVWHEKGQMWWWAIAINEKKKVEWEAEFKDYIKSLMAEAYDENGQPYEDGIEVYAIDFHI